MKTKEPDQVAILGRRLIKYKIISLIASVIVVLSFFVLMTGQGTDLHFAFSTRGSTMELLMWAGIIDLASMYRLSQLSRRRIILSRVRFFSSV